ncbi:hypothetical protein EON79_22560, partial [bacterium]
MSSISISVIDGDDRANGLMVAEIASMGPRQPGEPRSTFRTVVSPNREQLVHDIDPGLWEVRVYVPTGQMVTTEVQVLADSVAPAKLAMPEIVKVPIRTASTTKDPGASRGERLFAGFAAAREPGPSPETRSNGSPNASFPLRRSLRSGGDTLQSARYASVRLGSKKRVEVGTRTRTRITLRDVAYHTAPWPLESEYETGTTFHYWSRLGTSLSRGMRP